MAGHECHHCRQWVEAGEPHDCWTTTEATLTHDLPEDLRQAWERLRETAAEFGEQRIYASHHCIMFARRACYLFVRPKTRVLEVCIFLGRSVMSPRIRRARQSSRTKIAHIVHVTHRDEVEPPLSDWMREAYEMSDELSVRGRTGMPPKTAATRAKKAPASPARAKRKKAAARESASENRAGTARKSANKAPR